MLLDSSKLLLSIVQLLATSTVINIILLSSCCLSVNSLPITSKPIESTAENLAWEAWLMVPVGQQQKSRKVTPKSIFIVPHKNNQSALCPPGEHWSQSRCIPTVSIDTDKALLNTLSQYAPPSFDYDYDYEEEGNLTPGAEKLEGSADTNPFSVGDFADEPLKFNIFSETFPIGSSSGSGDSSGLKDSEDDNVFFVSERRRRPPTPSDMTLPDLDTDSSNYGHGPSNNESDNGDSKNPSDDGTTLFLSGIDAILVPAVSKDHHKNQNINFSIYQETLNTTLPQVNITSTDDEVTNHEIDDILKNESLILHENGAQVKTSTTTSTTTTTTERNEARTTVVDLDTTTTLKLEEYEDYDGKTEFTRSITDLPPIAEETSQPTNFEKDDAEMSTIIPKDVDTPTTIITEAKEDITTITSHKNEDITSSNGNEDISTITVLPNEETTTFTLPFEEEIAIPKEIPTTTAVPIEESTTITTSTSIKEDFTVINKHVVHDSESSVSNDRFVYHQLTEENASPPVMNIVEELRKINDLVAKNSRQPSTATTTTTTTTTTTQNPSEEEILKANALLSKIILVPNVMKSSSENPVPLSSTSIVWSSNSTSRNILSINSSSSSKSSSNSINSSSSTVSSTEQSQESTSDPSSSTSPKPEINEPDPYWWLPNGWSMERTEADRPLLLRFWSAISGISGSQTKV